MRNTYKNLVGKPEKTRPLRRPRHRQEHIKICLKETRWDDVDWINLAHDRDRLWALVNTIMNPWVL
jgi:hypothetical protein